MCPTLQMWMIRSSKRRMEEGVSAQEISERYIAECKKDMAGMNVKPATVHPQATQEIDGMIEYDPDLNG